MKNITFILVLLTSIISSNCCDDAFDDEKFTFIRADYTGQEMRINGYYFTDVENPEGFAVIVFYANGVFFHNGWFNDLFIFENKYPNGNTSEKLKNNKSLWGLYQVTNNNIEMESILRVGYPKGYLFRNKGEIINDSTIHLSDEVISNATFEGVNYKTFHFKQFSPKPDSTNNFIK